MDGAAAVLEMSGVGKDFADRRVLDGIGLTVGAGRIHGLVGPNGAGKTTLRSVLFGLVRADTGVVRLFGRSPEQAGAAWLDGVGGFIETPRFYPYLSGRKNLTTLAALDGGDASGLVGDLLGLVGGRFVVTTPWRTGPTRRS